jgi:hypothetical protein
MRKSAGYNGTSGNSAHPQLVSLAFLKWGPEFVSRLNGDFAICIYQKKDNRAYFFRDHLGIRPLAVSESDSAYFILLLTAGRWEKYYTEMKKWILIIFIICFKYHLLILPNFRIKM